MKTIWASLLFAITAAVPSVEGLPMSALKAFGPYPSLVGQEVVATNGVEAAIDVFDGRLAYDYGRQFFSPPVCVVKVSNHLADTFTCLLLPTSDLCTIALFDDQKQEVEKTVAGKSYGHALSDDLVRQWCDQWMQDQQGDGRQTILFPLRGTLSLTRGAPQMPVQISSFSLLDVFKITQPGDYELHVQLRLIQSAKDVSGNFHFPVMVLPETVTRIHIGAKELGR
jgi:hypothetical protein